MIKQVKLPLGRTIRVIEVRQGTELVSPIRIININKTVLRNTFFYPTFFQHHHHSINRLLPFPRCNFCATLGFPMVTRFTVTSPTIYNSFNRELLSWQFVL